MNDGYLSNLDQQVNKLIRSLRQLNNETFPKIPALISGNIFKVHELDQFQKMKAEAENKTRTLLGDYRELEDRLANYKAPKFHGENGYRQSQRLDSYAQNILKKLKNYKSSILGIQQELHKLGGDLFSAKEQNLKNETLSNADEVDIIQLGAGDVVEVFDAINAYIFIVYGLISIMKGKKASLA